MFNNFDHFKKATLSLFESSKSQKINLSQFREKFVTLLGFENLSALKANFEKENTELFNVVSVIYYVNDTINYKRDFIDNTEGNKKAEELFAAEIRELSDVSEEDIESYIEDGYFKTTYDDSKLFIVHSC